MTVKVPQILVVEDDASIRCGIVDALSFSGYEVIEGRDGAEGMQLADSASYDLLLLDLVMPVHTGFEILEMLAKRRPGQPVIILSARGEEADRVRGLTMGADDYIVKPFSVRELLARVDAVLRRSVERKALGSSVKIGNWMLDGSFLKKEAKEVELSEREVDILHYLVQANGRVVSRDELLKRVWNIQAKQLETRTVDMHMARLRQKLDDSDQLILQTVRGKGYRLGGENSTS